MNLQRFDFGKTPAGQAISLYTLTNRFGNSVSVTDYGAILVSVNVPDRSGRLANVNLGYSTLDPYLKRHPYFGATVGRFCNRIAGGQFQLNGRTYNLAINNGPNHLHGGIVGFDKQIWMGTEIRIDDAVGMRFQLHSPDGQEGYPGNLDATAEYIWNDGKGN